MLSERCRDFWITMFASSVFYTFSHAFMLRPYVKTLFETISGVYEDNDVGIRFQLGDLKVIQGPRKGADIKEAENDWSLMARPQYGQA